jgi:Druantia protein DruA
MTEDQSIRCQGRTLSGADLAGIQELIDSHPLWSRQRVFVELCRRWEWQTNQGVPKTYAARELLLKLEQRVGLRLPAVQEHQRRRSWGIPAELPLLRAPAEKIEQSLEELRPLTWHLAKYGTELRSQALGYLRQYHYLGCDRPVGSHLLYVVSDRLRRDVAVHLVGAAAWQCADRDRFIGWSSAARSRQLEKVANHSRFLILPWVRVKRLASHLLGQLARRLSQDWPIQHGTALALLESFVETKRFEGTAYRAANWQRVGQTTGRTRQEKHHRAAQPRKAIWVYPLQKNFRSYLGLAQEVGR